MKKDKKSVRKTVGILLASAVAVTAISTAPQLAAYSPVKLAFADPVRVEAPQTPNFADVVEAVTPAVVSVRVESDLRPVSNNGFRFDRRAFRDDDFRVPPFFRNNPFFFDEDGSERGDKRSERRSNRRHGDGMPRRFGMSQGSGFFISGSEEGDIGFLSMGVGSNCGFSWGFSGLGFSLAVFLYLRTDATLAQRNPYRSSRRLRQHR